MTEDLRAKARNFVTFLQSLPEEERVKGNEKERQRALAQCQEFQTNFRAGKCFLCAEELSAFERHYPCVHWLLQPPGFTKWDFMEVAKRFGCLEIQAFLRWVANEEASQEILMICAKTAQESLWS